MSTRQRFIDVAADLFYTHGFHTVGLDNILDAVGVTKTTFYNHFESKDDLIIAVLDHRDRLEAEQLDRHVREHASDDPRAQLHAVFDYLHDWFASPDFHGCMFFNAALAYPSPTDPINLAAVAHSRSFFEYLRTLAEKADADDPARLAEQLLLLVSGAVASTHFNGQPAGNIARDVAHTLIEHHLAQPLPRH
ncbi:MAG: TetR/AcrR family transcriptional regulator [Phycisphaerales bacterium]